MEGDAAGSRWRFLGGSLVGMVGVVAVFGALAIGFWVLADLSSDIPLVGRLFDMLGRLAAVGGAFFFTYCLLAVVLGPDLFEKLFFVRGKALTPGAIRELVAMEAASATIPVASGQGVLRIIPIKPQWWLDPNAHADDTKPVVVVEGIEHRLPGWDPYDVAVPAGTVEVVAWLPLRSGIPGRRAGSSVPVSEGRVGAVVFRPSSLPELPGTATPLAGELRGDLSSHRMWGATALLVGLVFLVWLAVG
ncbi:hypothetical protein LADH09A_001082 [Micromonospora sp. LAH09]|uniref:hypothetical protein n=1 Tax=Micromonospora cabrerizensis TaxID=2911213 RepID=UPI001EE85BF1|nr:hypothetical protein [Micromonospora cabrerizensis]MCG5467420.1 hypothetical protein [Micromonospora cabrerizensis]